jgi:hypothetical protein
MGRLSLTGSCCTAIDNRQRGRGKSLPMSVGLIGGTMVEALESWVMDLNKQATIFNKGQVIK